MKLKETQEGESIFLEPSVDMPEEGEVFYHPEQALARDISVLFYGSKKARVLDLMAASGARAIRLAKYGLEVTANDRSSEAIELIKKNAERNGVKLEVIQEDASVLLHKRWFEAVDLDPFGTPAPFVHCALFSAKRYLTVTSTDTAALAGTYPRVSKRRYGIITRRLPNYQEIGVRALASFVVREAAKLEIGARPLFAHSYRHYYRVYFEIKKGARRADKALKELGNYKSLGPLYMGNLWDKETIKGMQKFKMEFAHKLTKKHLDLIEREADYPQPFFHLHALCKELGLPAPRMDDLLEAVNGVRTHFSPLGFRTRLSEGEVKEKIKELVKI